MKLVKETSAAGCFPPELSYACFFHMQKEYFSLASSEKKVFRCRDEELEDFKLSREYQKLLYCGGNPMYLACSFIKQKNELVLYHLDQHLREFDFLKLRADGGTCVEDMWLDGENQLLYFVFPMSIQKYNLNGDLLGAVMRSPADTWYKAVCTWKNTMFAAYERLGCVYVAEYDRRGIYRDKFSIGGCFSVVNMEVICTDTGTFLYLYGKRQERITVCLEILIDTEDCPEEQIKTGKTKEEKTEDEKVNEICVELSTESGLEGTTCYLSCPDR